MSIKFTSTGIEFTNNIDQYTATTITTATTTITMNSKRFRLTANYTSPPNTNLTADTTHQFTVSNNKVQQYDTIVPNVLTNHPDVVVTVSNIINNQFTINIMNNGSDITNNVEISFLVLT
jgi:hypothetical protein